MRAKKDFFSIQTLYCAQTALGIVHILEVHLLYTSAIEPENLKICVLYLQAVRLELIFDGDINEFEDATDSEIVVNEHNVCLLFLTFCILRKIEFKKIEHCLNPL